jgi:hypothetical protein
MVLFSAVEIDLYLSDLGQRLDSSSSTDDLYQNIVNVPFDDKLHTTNLGLVFITLVLVNQKNKTIDRIAMTDNYMAQGARNVTVKPFEDLIVSFGHKGNLVVEAIRSGRYQQTNDWNNLLTPVLQPEEARLNQAASGIASSYIYPLPNLKPGGALIFQFYVSMDKISAEHRDFMFRYAKLVSQAINKAH